MPTKRARDIRILWQFASGCHYPYYPFTIADGCSRFAATSLGPKDVALLQRYDPEKGWVTVEKRAG